MGTDRRRDAATALTGAGLLAAGGGMRHAGVSGALRDKLGREPVAADYPKVHLGALKGARHGKGLYVGGALVGVAGAAGLSSGLLNLTRRKGPEETAKRDRQPLWQEGALGTADALRQRGESLKTPTPMHVRAEQLAIAGGAAAGGSALARLAMRKAPGKTKALVSPVAGALAAAASVPVSSRTVQRTTKGKYVVTPTGVRRAKDVIRKPSSKARQVSSRYGPMRQQVVPTDMGKADSYRTQRARITAASGTPLIGPYAGAHQAAHYAPKGHKAEAAARQIGYGPVAGTVAGVGAAYGGAALARRVAPVGTQAERAMQWRSDKINAVRHKVGMGPAKEIAADSRRGKALAHLKANRLAKPIMHNRGTAAAAALGYLGTKAIVGTAGTQLAISRNQRDQRELAKLDAGGRGQTKREKHKLASTKRLNAALATTSGVAGLTSLGLLATRHKAKAIPLSIVGSGIGGGNALIGARVQRHEAKAIDPVTKGLNQIPLGKLPRHAIHASHGKVRILEYHGENRFTVLDRTDTRRIAHRDQLTFVNKADETGGDQNDLIRRYGDRGPLPKHLPRDERMRAYEARVAAHGGHKQQKWQRRANVAEGLRNAGLAGGVLGGAAHLAGKTKRGHALLGAGRAARWKARGDTAAVAAATGGAAAELYGEYARHRRASYASSPGGVASSALTRMRANTPGEHR